jgi:hypothetical protein
MVTKLILATLLGAAIQAFAADRAPGEYQVKGAFLLNFAKFVEWPPQALAENDLAGILTWLLEERQAGETGLRWYQRLKDKISTLSELPHRCGHAPESTSLPFEMRQVCSMAVSPACTGCFSQSRATLFISSLSAAPIKTPCRCIDRLVSMEGRKGRACGIDGSGSRLILPTNLHEGPGQPGNWLLAHAISQAPGSATPESGSTCT